MKPRITNEGLEAQIRALHGEGITFTKIVMGNGAVPEDYRTLKDLMNPLVNIGLASYKIEEGGYVELQGMFSNSITSSSFYWREVGIFIQDLDDPTKDVLYAYGHVDLEDEEEIAAQVPRAGLEIYEIKLTYRIYVGEVDNLSAVLAESSVYVSQEDFDSHTNNTNNPHNVTADQVGLGNVPNVATDDQTPTIEYDPVYESDADDIDRYVVLNNGETLKELFKKLARGMVELANHLKDKVVHITSAERTKWNNKAEKNHTHAAADITSGTLGIARGGTGATSAAGAAKKILANGVSGIAGMIEFADSGNNSSTFRGIAGTMGTNDYFRVGCYGTGDDTGVLELSTEDNGDEVHVHRQYRHNSGEGERQGKWKYVYHQAIILNSQGNTVLTGSCTASSHITASDRKKKENIEAIKEEAAKELILGLQPVMYDLKADEKKHHRMGFVAQDVYELMQRQGYSNSALYQADMLPKDMNDLRNETILDDAEIEKHDDSELDWTIDYQQLIAPLVALAKEQERRISELEKKLNA